MDNTPNFYLTTHNTDLSELRGWQQPDGIWSSERAALGGMRDGAYQPGQGVDVRRVEMNGEITDSGVASKMAIGSYENALGHTTIGYVPINVVRATPEQVAEMEKLESELGRSFTKEAYGRWLNNFHEARRDRLHPSAHAFDGNVSLLLAPVTRHIGDRVFETVVIAGLFTDPSKLKAAMSERRLADPESPALTYVSVRANTSFDLEVIFRSEDAFTEVVVQNGAADKRYTELLQELGL
jgi:hypothetical protein